MLSWRYLILREPMAVRFLPGYAQRKMVRTLTKHGDDILPVVTVWLPTAVLTYLVTYKAAEFWLRASGYTDKIPVDICGGGSCTTVRMVAAEYHAGPIGITAMLLVLGAWWVRDELTDSKGET